MRWFPVVGWAERGGSLANGHGNSVPRFHITWGTGPGVLDPFVRLAREAEKKGLLSFRFRHQVDELITTNGAVTGARGTKLAPDPVQRGGKSNRDPSAISKSPRAPRSSLQAASAATTIWCARTGRRTGSASRRNSWSRACLPMSMGA